MERALQEDPNNSRYVFHLGLTYETAEEHTLALKTFEKRLDMDGPDDGQIFYSLFRIGRLQEKLKMDPEIFIASYERAYASRPTRAEPLYHLANHYLEVKKTLISFALSKWALTFAIPKNDLMLVDLPIYEFYLPLQYAQSALQIKKYDEMKSACNQLLAKPNLPHEIKTWIQQNLSKLKFLG